MNSATNFSGHVGEHPSARKRLFIGLIIASFLTLGAVLGIIWYFTISRDTLIQYVIWVTAVVLLIGAAVLTALGIAVVIFSLLLHKPFPPFQGIMHTAVNIMFPFALWLGKILNIDTDKIRGSFIEVNNQLVRSKHIKAAPPNLLVLIPHCLQNSKCPYKITMNIDNCRRCGKCAVKDILELRDEYGFRLAIATGGTVARKWLSEYRPQAVVAVACERDLTSGIQDAGPIPVLGVTNQRPNGPCFNTQVDIGALKELIDRFIGTELGG